MRKTTLFVLLIFAFATFAAAQVRPPETSGDAENDMTPVPDVLPETIEANYQGGLFGYSDKQKGYIKFDDINERLVFLGKDEKEKFSIPYYSIKVVYPSQKKVRSGTGRAVGAIPLPGAGIGGLFMKKKKNYMVIEFEDPEVDVTGTINFLLDTSEILDTAVHTVGQKAEMEQRGDAYIRRKGT